MMIADNADTLRSFNDEEIHISKALIERQKLKALARKRKMKARQSITRLIGKMLNINRGNTNNLSKKKAKIRSNSGTENPRRKQKSKGRVR